MTLLLNNDDVAATLSMRDAIDAIASAYADAHLNRSGGPPRNVIWSPLGPGSRHALASLQGAGLSERLAAVRIRSDVYATPGHDGSARDTKHAGQQGLFCGLVLLFAIDDGTPVAIINDGLMQQMRVGATSAIAADRLARADARRLCVIGAGGQARAHALAFAQIRALEQVTIASPNPGRRGALADELRDELGVEVRDTDDIDGAVAGADLVAACTNARSPVFRLDALAGGTHVTSVRPHTEIDPRLTDRAARSVVHQRDPAIEIQLGDDDERAASRMLRSTDVDDLDQRPDLVDLLTGDTPARGHDDEITYFANNRGTGIQFVACGSIVLRRAREQGRGRELPTEWFLQDTSS